MSIMLYMSKDFDFKFFNSSKIKFRDFPGSPMVGTSASNARVAGSFPVQGGMIPHDSCPKNQNVEAI